MLPINTKITWRTNGRGVTEVLKGTIVAHVVAGKLPSKLHQMLAPHGNKLSNRDRYIVDIGYGRLAWANVKTAVIAGKRPVAPFAAKKATAKKAVKVSERVSKRLRMTPKQKIIEGEDPYIDASGTKVIAPVKKKSGGDKPKTTWYAIVDGKIVSARKVLCPEGYTKEKPVAAPAPVIEDVALPQAAV